MAALRPVPYKRPVRVFERDGFTYHRTKGDHLRYVKSRNRRPIVILRYNSAPSSSSKTFFERQA